jgi:hypothetical protein
MTFPVKEPVGSEAGAYYEDGFANKATKQAKQKQTKPKIETIAGGRAIAIAILS